MTKYTINRGWHHGLPLTIGFFRSTRIDRDVSFNENCVYMLPEGDQNDVNKLFGFGYLDGLHHQDSARVGWNYDPLSNGFKLWAYTYVSGIRGMLYLCSVKVHKRVTCSVMITKPKGHDKDVTGNYRFEVSDKGVIIGETDVPFYHNKIAKYKLGCYFGGNRRAPHKMTIEMSKVK